ncbi:deoxyribose-phosphate aldolase [Clostridium sp. PL3]|uniref:Deoxyribose-phosphate aldolase n=1 Tax=Clostridium thailandense TaxID=2794346 RepID=A0A949TIQ9_9CLOT|nr:deoxyribose-phosphate aldolase [Clostridium thailandense]MBV7273579.1 deoxyribose-phosphate aldolase [Clostridium thailandense]
MSNENLAKMIDHTLLKANATQEDIVKLSQDAKQYGFASVCVNPTWVKTAHEVLKDTTVKVCTVIGFPLGASSSRVKAYEAKVAIEDGATEVDMVINIGALKGKSYDVVEQDIKEVVESAKGKALVKVIIETCLLTDEEKVKVCEIAVKAGTDFVKTSTGFSTGGATVEDIALMRKTVGPNIGVKASGGVRSYEDAAKMIKAGASRIGTSNGVTIINGETAKESY